MDPLKRKSFQGVVNIIRFNWHFYVMAVLLLLLSGLSVYLLPRSMYLIIVMLVALAAASVFISLVVSWYVYDASGLYTLNWLDKLGINPGKRLVNIHAGFDETSALLQYKYPDAALLVFDFYDPAKHTEISIERARKAYPPYPGTLQIRTDNVPLAAGSSDHIFLILAAHEIRDEKEQVIFFRQLMHATAPGGSIILAEHQRDLPNFLAFSVGFFHFFSGRRWKNIFEKAGLRVHDVSGITPFITVYKLSPDGAAS